MAEVLIRFRWAEPTFRTLPGPVEGWAALTDIRLRTFAQLYWAFIPGWFFIDPETLKQQLMTLLGIPEET